MNDIVVKFRDYLIPDKLYDVLKWVGLVALPAVAWWVSTCGEGVGIANVEVVVTIINATGTLIGMLIGASEIGGIVRGDTSGQGH